MNRVPRYHHGDLRNALLKAGHEILEEKGLEALSLRAVAARVGVSHSAPAYHFGSLKGLLTGLVTEAYARFAASMADQRARSEPSPIEQIRAAGRGYVAFAQRNPALFRLMFSSVQLDSENLEMRGEAEKAYRQLIEISIPAAEAQGAKTEEEKREIANLIWTATHGYAHLLIEGRMSGPGQSEADPPPDIADILFRKLANIPASP